MSDLENDKSDLENQGLDINNQPGNEELAKLQAQLSASSNESKLVNEVNKVLLSNDFDYFQDLIGKDKVMANRVIEKIAKQKGIEIEEVKKLLLKDVQPKTINPEDIELKVKETIAKQEGEKALEEFIITTGLKKDTELNDEFLSNFEEYMQGKDWNATNVKKFAKSAYRDLNEDKVKSFEKKKGEIEAQITTGGSSKQTDKKTEGRQLLRGSSQNDW